MKKLFGIYNGTISSIEIRNGVCNNDCILKDKCCHGVATLIIDNVDILSDNCDITIGDNMVISNISKDVIISTHEDIYENFCKEFCIRYSKNDNEDICDNKDDELNCPLNFLFNKKNE